MSADWNEYPLAVEVSDSLRLLGIGTASDAPLETDLSDTLFLKKREGIDQFSVFSAICRVLIRRQTTVDPWKDDAISNRPAIAQAIASRLSNRADPGSLLSGFGSQVLKALQSLAVPLLAKNMPKPSFDQQQTVDDSSEQIPDPFDVPHIPSLDSSSKSQSPPSGWSQEVQRVKLKLPEDSLHQATALRDAALSSEILNPISNLISTVEGSLKRSEDFKSSMESAFAEKFLVLRKSEEEKAAVAHRLGIARAEHEAATLQLQKISEALADAKRQLEEQSEIATDSGQLTRVKKVAEIMKSELQDMDVKIALLLNRLDG